MRDIGITIGGCDFTDPGFDLVLRDLHYDTAITTHEVMMVFGRLAVAEQGLALGGAKDIDYTLTGERLQIVVHGRKADALALRLDVFEDLLRGTEAIHPG